MTVSLNLMPSLGFGSAAEMIWPSSTTCVMVPPSTPPDRRIMSGRRCLIRSICSCGRRPSFEASTSITMAPAPSAARCALSAVMLFTTPATII